MVRPQQSILCRPEGWVTCGILLRPICRVFTRRLHLGYSVRTAQRWWQGYREGGLAGLLAPPQRRGMVERITPEAWEGLQAEMRAGHIGGLHEAQVYLRDTWHIVYGIDAISKLFRRRKTKLKTGRPHHRKAASPAEQAAFKK
jgi:transposase